MHARALVTLVGLLLIAAPARAADPPPEATRLFETGVRYLEDPMGPRYEQAYRAFQAAYRAYPSPKILGNLGLCAMMLERDGEALSAYRRYLDEVDDIPDDERRDIQRELEVLEASAVPFTLQVSPEDAVVIDRREPVKKAAVINRYELTEGQLSLRLRAGHHRIEIQREGFTSQTLELDAEPGRALSRTVSLERPPPPTKPKPAPSPAPYTQAPFIVAASLTGAFAVATAITGGIALSTHADYEDARAAGDRARGDDLLGRGEALNITTDVLLGATVAGAVTSAVLFFVDVGSNEPPVELNAALSPDGGAFALRYSF